MCVVSEFAGTFHKKQESGVSNPHNQIVTVCIFPVGSIQVHVQISQCITTTQTCMHAVDGYASIDNGFEFSKKVFDYNEEVKTAVATAFAEAIASACLCLSL